MFSCLVVEKYSTCAMLYYAMQRHSVTFSLDGHENCTALLLADWLHGWTDGQCKPNKCQRKGALSTDCMSLLWPLYDFSQI